MIILIEVLFDCSALIFDLPYKIVLLQEILNFIPYSITSINPPSLEVYT